jgi:acylphosphatase
VNSRIIIRVTGRVHDVGFRVSAQRQAMTLHLTGLVRNEPDGSVYLEAEGDPAALDAFLAWCHEGPPHAAVERVEHHTAEPAGHSGFTIQ